MRNLHFALLRRGCGLLRSCFRFLRQDLVNPLLTLILNGSDKRKTPKEFAEKLFIATSAPEGVIEKKTFTARLKASPDTNR
jgi:hypothetical protein